MGQSRDRGGRAIRLRLTTLEDRTLPASGVTGSLTSGILRIADRLAADALVFHQTPTGVTVTATDTNQVYTGVTQVMADVQNTDTVTNDVSGLAGTAARSVYLSRRDPTGTSFVSSGNLAPGATSGPSGTTNPPPPPPTGGTTADSGVTATQAGGVLRVTDRLTFDTLVLHQTPTGVAVTATGTNLTFTSVTQVTADVVYTDTVTNDVSGLGGAAARSVYLSRRNPTGATFVSSGNLAPGATSTPPISTTPPPTTPPPTTPPPPNPDWFDTMLTDAGIRSLARTVAGDGTIDRIDMLALFAQAASEGPITANEIHDFKELENPDWTENGATPNQAPLFTMPAPVRGLLSEVVDGDPANATYQGTPLGNLQAGSSATQLQKLVDKWFLGLDHPTAESGTTYTRASGSLFGTGPADTNVHQGNLNDCYFLATLNALAQDRPAAITSMFTNNGDGTYTVRFFDNGVAKYVTVDSMLPTDSSGKLVYDGAGSSANSTSNVLWPELAEKAYAQLNQSGWIEHNGTDTFSGIEIGYSDTAFQDITGGTTSWTQIIQANSAQLQAAVTAAEPTILNSLASPGNGVIGSHTYAVVGYNPTTQQFNLSNPLGGFIQLTWAQINQSFSGFWQLQ